MLIPSEKKEKINQMIKALLREQGYIRLGKHSKQRISERGYYEADIISCLYSGRIMEMKKGFNSKLKKDCVNITVEGNDMDNNPVVIVFSEEGDFSYSIVTIMPPTDKKRFTCVI